MKTLKIRLIVLLVVALSIPMVASAQSPWRNYSFPPTPVPVISLTHASLSFFSLLNQGALTPQMVGISNAGVGMLKWSAGVTSGAWLGVSPASGTGDGTLTVTANSAGLAIGNYTGVIRVTAQDADPRTITVILSISLTGPTISLTSNSLSFSFVTGGQLPPVQTVGITNAGGGSLEWTARVTSSGSWLSVTPSSGAGNGTLRISVIPAGLESGKTYNGSIMVSAAFAAAETINVTFMIIPCEYDLVPASVSVPASGGVGQLSVVTGPACSWTASSDASWLFIRGLASGSGNGTVTYEALANTTYGDRRTVIKIGGRATDFVQAEPPRNSSYSLPLRGGISLTTSNAGPLSIGYAHVQPDSGRPAPAGLAIFGYRSGGVLVSETTVPVSALLSSGRTYMEVSLDGNVSTGIAIANPYDQRATIKFTLTDARGTDFKSGTVNVEAHGQITGFLDEAPYVSGKGVQGSFSFISDVPVSVVAIRGYLNERREFLMTTLPVVDTARTISDGVQVLPHFSAGNGWTTQIVLLNHTAGLLTGKVEFLNPAGGASSPLVVVNLDGQGTSATDYAIPAGGSSRFVVTSSIPVAGSARIIPTGAAAPFPFALFSYKPGAFTVSEAGTSSTVGRDLGMYVESSENVSSGIAITNTTSSATTVTLQVTRLSDGAVIATSAPLSLSGNGQLAGGLQTFLPSLPASMQGVLRVSAGSTVSVLGFRMRYNERGDFLVTTTLPIPEASPTDSSPRVAAQFVNGEGFATQFILFNSFLSTPGTPTPSGALRLFDRFGKFLNLDLR